MAMAMAAGSLICGSPLCPSTLLSAHEEVGSLFQKGMLSLRRPQAKVTGGLHDRRSGFALGRSIGDKGHCYESQLGKGIPIRNSRAGTNPQRWLRGVGSRNSGASKKINNIEDKMMCTCLHVYRESFQNRASSLQMAVDSDSYVPLVKMCGITSVQDAIVAVEAGAKFIGMILWPKSKRSVPLDIAKEISKAAREHGAEPVGVFVEEDANVIAQVCDATNIGFVQLHGNGARSALSTLVQCHRIIYVLHVDEDGQLLTKPPNEECSGLIDWILVDSLQGGSGKKFDWDKFQVPSVPSKYGWILAGGIDPENVGKAISSLRPDVVDVSSGICKADGIQKDPARIDSFMNAVMGWK